MLVLTRKTQQSIKIADDIEITILSIQGDQVKIGIDAPKSVEIHRKEVFEAIQVQNSEAASIPISIMDTITDWYKGEESK